MENLQKLSLDIMNNHSYEYIFANQYDVGRTIEITITDDNEPMNLNGVTAIFSMLKPDGTFIANNCDVSGSVVTVIVTEQMTVYPGKSNYQIILKKNDVTISTIKGVIIVENAAVEDGTAESGSESSMWDDIISRSDDTKTYYEYVKSLVESGSYDGSHGMLGIGVNDIDHLPTEDVVVGSVYTITNPFYTTSIFKCGAGILYPAWTTVYMNEDGKWVPFPGIYRHATQQDAPTNGALIWEQSYTPVVEPERNPPIASDTPFFTLGSSSTYANTLNQLLRTHVVSDVATTAFIKSSVKRGNPVANSVFDTDETLYLDFQVDHNGLQVIWWWTDGGEVHYYDNYVSGMFEGLTLAEPADLTDWSYVGS